MDFLKEYGLTVNEFMFVSACLYVTIFMISMTIGFCNFMAKMILVCNPANVRRWLISDDETQEIENLIQRCWTCLEEIRLLKQILDMINKNQIPKIELVDGDDDDVDDDEQHRQGQTKERFNV